MLTDFVEAGDNVAEVDPGCPSFCHLVEQVIPEKLQQVAVTRLWPRWVLLKPEPHSTKSQSSKTTTDPIPMDVTKVLLTLAARWWCPIWLTSGRDGHFVPPAKKNKIKFKKIMFSSPKRVFILFFFTVLPSLDSQNWEGRNKTWPTTQICCLNYLQGASSSSSWVENKHSASNFWVGSQNRYKWGLVRLNHSCLFTNTGIQRKQCSVGCWHCRLRTQTSKLMKKTHEELMNEGPIGQKLIKSIKKNKKYGPL